MRRFLGILGLAAFAGAGLLIGEAIASASLSSPESAGNCPQTVQDSGTLT